MSAKREVTRSIGGISMHESHTPTKYLVLQRTLQVLAYEAIFLNIIIAELSGADREATRALK